MDWALAMRWLHPWRINAARLEAKNLFKLRGVVNYTIAIAIFIPLLFFLMLIDPFYVFADAVALGIVSILYFQFLKKRPVWIFCNHCDDPLTTQTPWVCGDCTWQNKDVVDFPFINRCEKCGVEPKAYKCHHTDCKEIIFLTEDEDPTNFAYRLDSSPGLSESSKVAETAKKRQNEIDKLQHKEKKESIKFRIKNMQNIQEVESALAEATTNLLKYFDKATAVREAGRLLKLEVDKQYPGDKNRGVRAEKYLIIDNWVREQELDLK